MEPSENTSAGRRSGLDLIQMQRTRNLLLLGIVGLIALGNAAFVAVIVGAIARSIVIGVVVMCALTALMASGFLWFESAACSRTRAQPLDGHPYLRELVTRMAADFQIPVPEVMIVNDPAPNAFAIGFGSRAKVTYTTGILDLLSDAPDDLEAVTAHELAHIANHDSRVSIAFGALLTWADIISVIVQVGAGVLFRFGWEFPRAVIPDDNPIAVLFRFMLSVYISIVAAFVYAAGTALSALTWLLSLGLGRQREWMADTTAAYMSGKPLAMCSALARMEELPTGLDRGGHLVQDLCVMGATGGGGWWSDLVETHPSTGRRIARLRAMAAGATPPGVSLAPFLGLLLVVFVLVGSVGYAAAMSASASGNGSQVPVAIGSPSQESTEVGPSTLSSPTATVQDSPQPSTESPPDTSPPPDTASPSPTLSPTTQAPHQDWYNTTYTSTCGGQSTTPLSVALHAGTGEATSNATYRFNVIEVVSGELTASARPDVGVALSCGNESANFGSWELQIFKSDSTPLGTLVVRPLPDALYPGVDLVPGEFRISGGQVRAGVKFYGPHDCHACGPSIHRMLTWRWDGSNIVPV